MLIGEQARLLMAAAPLPRSVQKVEEKGGGVNVRMDTARELKTLCDCADMGRTMLRPYEEKPKTHP
jgi:hypothetical protein